MDSRNPVIEIFDALNNGIEDASMMCRALNGETCLPGPSVLQEIQERIIGRMHGGEIDLDVIKNSPAVTGQDIDDAIQRLHDRGDYRAAIYFSDPMTREEKMVGWGELLANHYRYHDNLMFAIARTLGRVRPAT